MCRITKKVNQSEEVIIKEKNKKTLLKEINMIKQAIEVEKLKFEKEKKDLENEINQLLGEITINKLKNEWYAKMMRNMLAK